MATCPKSLTPGGSAVSVGDPAACDIGLAQQLSPG